MTVGAWQAGKIYPTGSVCQPATAPPPISATLVNPGFESGDVSYDKDAGWTIVNQPADAFQGSWVARFFLNGTGKITADTPFPVVPGTSITATLAVDQGASSSGNAGARVALVWYDGASVEISESLGTNITSGSDGEYQTSTVTAAAPAGAAFVAVRCIAFANGTQPVYVDSFVWNYVDIGTGGLIYKAVQPATGVSGPTEPIWPQVIGVQVNDGTVIWEAMAGTRVVWEAHPILVSGDTEPAWPLLPDGIVADGTIRWRAFPRVITDENCPQTIAVAIMEGHVFAVDDDVVRFSAALDARDWTTVEDAGFLNSGLQQANANGASVLAPYRANLTVWSATTFQNYQMDADPALMVLLDQMDGLGCRFPKTAVAIADDLLFLADVGVRSVNVSVAGENLASGDVGAPIDELVRRSLEIAEANDVEPFATYWPGFGQYLLAFGGEPVDDVIVSGDLGDGPTGEVVDFAYTATGGVGPKTFALAPGSLPVPAGLTFNPDGTITGTRTEPGLYGPWEVIATDTEGLESPPHEDESETTPIYYMLGPLEQMVDGVPTVGYLRTSDPEDWDVPLFQFPQVWGANSTGFNEVNGMLFVYGASTGDDAYVSANGGVFWSLCDTTFCFASMMEQQGVWFDGLYYFRQHLRSLDGQAWEVVPNKPLPGQDAAFTVAYPYSGTVVMAFNNSLGGTLANYRSQDHGETWEDIGVPYGYALWGPFGLERDGGRIWTVNSGDGPAYTDTQFDTFVSNTGIGPGGCYYQRDGVWLGMRAQEWKRVTGTDTAWEVVHTFAGVDQNFYNQNTFVESEDGATIYGVERISMSELRILKSVDQGQTWALSSTIATTANAQSISLIRYRGVGVP